MRPILIALLLMPIVPASPPRLLAIAQPPEVVATGQPQAVVPQAGTAQTPESSQNDVATQATETSQLSGSAEAFQPTAASSKSLPTRQASSPIQIRWKLAVLGVFFLIVAATLGVLLIATAIRQRETRDKSLRASLFGLLFCSIFFLWCGAQCSVFAFYDWPSSAANLGDSFNVANSLFSAFAFAGALAAILLQTNELRLQREDMRVTRRQFRSQAESAFLTTYLAVSQQYLDQLRATAQSGEGQVAAGGVSDTTSRQLARDLDGLIQVMRIMYDSLEARLKDRTELIKCLTQLKVHLLAIEKLILNNQNDQPNVLSRAISEVEDSRKLLQQCRSLEVDLLLQELLDLHATLQRLASPGRIGRLFSSPHRAQRQLEQRYRRVAQSFDALEHKVSPFS